MSASDDQKLLRELGLFGAMMMGLGSILGTGVFVSIGLAPGVSRPSVVLATALEAGVATCNGLSSAQLAANHPVSGGTYEYGYEFMDRRWGFMAGWMFLLAKTASAATAALQLTAEQRMFPRIIPILGVVGSLGLAFWVKPAIWLTGLGLILAGLDWHAVAYRMRQER